MLSFVVITERQTRYRLVPPFGHSTIRRFCSNASQMKRFAARNFEDFLQVFPFLSVFMHD